MPDDFNKLLDYLDEHPLTEEDLEYQAKAMILAALNDGNLPYLDIKFFKLVSKLPPEKSEELLGLVKEYQKALGQRLIDERFGLSEEQLSKPQSQAEEDRFNRIAKQCYENAARQITQSTIGKLRRSLRQQGMTKTFKDLYEIGRAHV